MSFSQPDGLSESHESPGKGAVESVKRPGSALDAFSSSEGDDLGTTNEPPDRSGREVSRDWRHRPRLADWERLRKTWKPPNALPDDLEGWRRRSTREE